MGGVHFRGMECGPQKKGANSVPLVQRGGKDVNRAYDQRRCNSNCSRSRCPPSYCTCDVLSSIRAGYPLLHKTYSRSIASGISGPFILRSMSNIPCLMLFSTFSKVSKPCIMLSCLSSRSTLYLVSSNFWISPDSILGVL